jgi:hypothetical protein
LRAEADPYPDPESILFSLPDPILLLLLRFKIPQLFVLLKMLQAVCRTRTEFLGLPETICADTDPDFPNDKQKYYENLYFYSSETSG